MRSRVLTRAPLLLLPLLAAGIPAGNPGDVRLALREGSRLWIEGDSNLHEWSCEVGGFEPDLRVDRVGPGTPPTQLIAASATVSVAAIECGSGKMNDNLRKALDWRNNPTIGFTLSQAQLVDPGVPGPGGVEAMVTGRLSVAGTTRDLSLHVSGTDTGENALRLQGSARIKMSDWGVEPPTAMLGLLKTADEVSIVLDLTAEYDGQ